MQLILTPALIWNQKQSQLHFKIRNFPPIPLTECQLIWASVRPLENIYFLHLYTASFSIRSTHWRCSIKKAVLKNSAIFTGKQLCWGLKEPTYNNIIFMNKRLQHQCFPVNIAKFQKTTILRNLCEQLLLTFQIIITLLN